MKRIKSRFQCGIAERARASCVVKVVKQLIEEAIVRMKTVAGPNVEHQSAKKWNTSTSRPTSGQQSEQ